MVQRRERPVSMRPRQFGYPSPFRGQVCGIQCSLPCFPSMGLSSWRPPSLRRVPVSPVPRRHRYYEGATTSRACIPGSLWFRFRAPQAPPPSCSPRRSLGGGGPRQGLGSLVSRSPLCPASREWARTGSLRFPGAPSIPLPGSQTPVGPTGPHHLRSLRCCPRSQHAEGSNGT